MPDLLRPVVEQRTRLDQGYRDHASHQSMTVYLSDWEAAYARLGAQIELLRRVRDERKAAKESGLWPATDPEPER